MESEAAAPAVEWQAASPGATIGGYRLLERLHAGGAGCIYRVEPVNPAATGFPLVMKVPAIGPREPVEALVGFEMELMIHPTLTGPHVPRLVASADLRATPFLVMEEVRGRSLAAVAKAAPLPESEVAAIGAAVADALQSLHEQGAVHQDLKPDNVMLREDGTAVLLDFGFAHHARYPDLLAEERRFTAGSAPYVSPEQVRDRRGDPRSDLFALGVVLYELVTGELPFGAPETAAGLRDRLWRLPAPPRARVASITPAMQEVILRCLEIDAEKRYQSAAHVAFDLRDMTQVQLKDRSHAVQAPGLVPQLRAWWRSRTPSGAGATEPGPRLAPVILIAVDTTRMEDARHPRIQEIARRIMSVAVEHRVMCVSVIRSVTIGEGAGPGASQSAQHLEHLAKLRRWVEPLGLPDGRLSLHVLEAFDAGDAIVALARGNHADLIVLGAPAPDEKVFGWWRSVASGVTATAHCSVYVVRVPG